MCIIYRRIFDNFSKKTVIEGTLNEVCLLYIYIYFKTFIYILLSMYLLYILWFQLFDIFVDNFFVVRFHHFQQFLCATIANLYSVSVVC